MLPSPAVCNKLWGARPAATAELSHTVRGPAVKGKTQRISQAEILWVLFILTLDGGRVQCGRLFAIRQAQRPVHGFKDT